MSKGLLVLEDGSVFEGELFGHAEETAGEVVFNTSLTGYQEILTDPSYSGQIVVMTYPLIGNYGANKSDEESALVQASGLVVGNYEDNWSNFQGKESLDKYLKESKVPGISGIDTRALTRLIRGSGAMRGIISSGSSASRLLKKVLESPVMSGLDLVKNVTTRKSYEVASQNPKYRIAFYDFGTKKNILNELLKFDVRIKIFNAKASPEEVLDFGPDGIFLSNGPGDPAAVDYGVKNAAALSTAGIPMFGICLGHQILALAFGGKTYKLKFGHRGGNHPVKNHQKNSIEITSQNHGFAVDEDSLDRKNIRITHTNLYDSTNEGLAHRKYPVMSVQYHPEASPGPHDSKYLFSDFMKLVARTKK